MNSQMDRVINTGSPKTPKVFRGVNKRPLFVMAAFFALGIILGRYVHFQTVYIIAAAVFAIAAFCFHHKKVLWLVCLCCVLFAAFLSANAYGVDYLMTGDGMRVTGRVYAEPYQNDYGSTVYLLDHASIDGQACGNIKLYEESAGTFACGDVVAATAEVEIPKGVRNPGGFDEKLYLLSQGIVYKAYADGAETIGTEGGLAVMFANVREFIGDTIEGIFEEDIAPVAKAMLLGDKQGLDEQTYSAFKDTGMAHVLAVSGLHAGILIAFVYYLLRLLKAGRRARLIMTLAFIAAYACVTGLSPSIVRASIMAAALLLGVHFGRQTDTLNYLSLTFILSLIINPLDLFTASFQLSFGAVFGMLTLGWQIKYWLDRRMPQRIAFIGDGISVSAGATAGTMPVIAGTFNRISVLSVVTNILIVPLASAVIVMVFISTFLGMVFAPAAIPAVYVASALIRFMLYIIGGIAAWPFAAFDVASPPWYAVLACFALLFICSKYLLVRIKLKAFVSGAVLAAVVLVMLVSQPSGMYIVFLDVGEGDAAFIQTEQGGEYFIDGGREMSVDEMVGFTIRNGITPDAAFVSHTDDDHFSGIVALYEAGLLDKVYCSWQEKDTVEAAMPHAEVVALGAGDKVLLDGDTEALVLYPYRDTKSDDTNELSLVLLVQYNGHTALFTGDISGATETEIFASLDDVDIYKAAHHGSKYSSYRLPLSVLTPKFSIVSVGDNSFGHPHAWAMQNLGDYSGEVYTTMDDYAVEFYIGGGVTVNTYGE
ncbi:MAG: DNA internalization-related competence protein ComEC/Rec2 [Eubacteriales bacterium]|nr:DNA internalization-related competence protein ComEC/Rec2 [Eubacteriales bacterium]